MQLPLPRSINVFFKLKIIIALLKINQGRIWAGKEHIVRCIANILQTFKNQLENQEGSVSPAEWENGISSLLRETSRGITSSDSSSIGPFPSIT